MNQKILDAIKNYQRPIRMCIWVICIAVSYMYSAMGWNKGTIDTTLTQTILYGMFIDLGIYTGARTYEKIAQAKIDGTQVIAQTTNANNTVDASLNTGAQ